MFGKVGCEIVVPKWLQGWTRNLIPGLCVAVALWSAGQSAVIGQDQEIADPENIAIDSKGENVVPVMLKCTYYPGVKDKKTTPVIIVHELGGRRAQVHQLALSLQHTVINGSGFSVIVPDLRGHGESTQLIGGGALRYDKMKPAMFEAMGQDIEACKRFLKEKNNAGELNLEQLCLIGIGEMGSMIAWKWTNVDWNWTPLPGLGKQGQDVKALVLVSPKNTFKGMGLKLDNPIVASRLSTMIVCGERDNEGEKFYDLLKAKHAPLPKTQEDQFKFQDLFLVNLEAAVSGPRLLDPNLGLNVNEKIIQFLNLRIVNKQDEFRWQDRTKKES